MTLLDSVSELYRYRALLWNLVYRDLTVRYKRSVLGFAWTMLNPVIMTVVFTVVFSTVFRCDMDRFIVYFLSGYVIWSFMAQSTSVSSRSILSNGSLISKIYVPKAVFVLSTVLSGLVNMGFTLLPLLVVLLVTGTRLTGSLLFLPIAVCLVFLFTLGISLLVSAVAVFFTDVVDMYQVSLMPWMYLTPIFYPIEVIPPKYSVVITLNPMYYLVECFRTPIYLGRLPGLDAMVISGLVSVAAFAVGYLVFAKLERSFVFYV